MSRARCGSPSRPSCCPSRTAREEPSAAVELFLERARSARPGFERDGDAVALAAEIARRVDGLPLAIELAAARVNVLGLAELASILARRAALLREGTAADPTRTALQELVDWSYDLLHGDEKTLLQQLAVHRGGASLASLSAVAATHGLDEPTVVYLVGALVDKSIVSASFSGGVARYDVLDTVREHVLERLAESGGGDLAAARRAHAEHFATLAEQAHAELRGADWLRWVGRLELENDNFWAALAYARDAPDPAVAIRLGTLGLYWVLAERISEGRRFLDIALAATREDAPVALRIELLANLCYLAGEELDLDAALAAGERALALAETAAAPRELGLAQFTLALALAQSPDHGRAEAMARDACATLEAAGDDWGVAASSLSRAVGAAAAGDVATVAAMAAAVRRHSDALGYDAFRVPGLLLEAWVAERRQEAAVAVERYRQAVELATRVGFGDHAAFALSALGGIALAGGDLREAASSSARRLPKPRPLGRRGWRPTRASSSHAMLRAPGMRTPPRDCSGRSSPGRRNGGSARRARSCSSRSPAARRGRRCWVWRSSPTSAATPPRPRISATARSSRSPPPAELAAPPPRLAERWHRRTRAFPSSASNEREAPSEHDDNRRPACGGPPPDRAAAGARVCRHLSGERAHPRGASMGSGGWRQRPAPRRATTPTSSTRSSRS